MAIGQEIGVPCVDEASLKSGNELLSNVYASRKGRSPSATKGMANADTVMTRLENGAVLKDALMPGASYEGWHSHCKLFPLKPGLWSNGTRRLVAPEGLKTAVFFGNARRPIVLVVTRSPKRILGFGRGTDASIANVNSANVNAKRCAVPRSNLERC